MRRLAVLLYVGVLLAGIYFAYQWNKERVPKRIKIKTFDMSTVTLLTISRGGESLLLEPDKEDSQRWIFSTNLDAVRSYSVEALLVKAILDSLVSAPYAYLVEGGGRQSLQHYGLGQRERYRIEVKVDDRAEPYLFELGALAVNGYDTFILVGDDVYRASFVGFYERLEALSKVIDVILGVEDRIFS